MILIAILVILSLIILFCLCKDKQDVSFNAKDAVSMASPKTLKKKREECDRLKEKANKEDEYNYKMLKKLIAKEAKSGCRSLYYNEIGLFNSIIPYRVKDRLRAEGFTVDNATYGFWIRW